MTTLPEANLQILMIFLLLGCQEALLQRLVMVRDGVSVRNMHVVNTVCPSLPKVADQ